MAMPPEARSLYRTRGVRNPRPSAGTSPSRIGAMAPRTLFEKIWDLHVIAQPPGSNESLLYVDWNLVHEGPFYAFDGLRQEGREVRRPLQTLAFADHYVPTLTRAGGTTGIADPEVRTMIEQLEQNAARTKIVHFGLQHEQQGIMHVVGPELGCAQ